MKANTAVYPHSSEAPAMEQHKRRSKKDKSMVSEADSPSAKKTSSKNKKLKRKLPKTSSISQHDQSKSSMQARPKPTGSSAMSSEKVKTRSSKVSFVSSQQEAVNPTSSSKPKRNGTGLRRSKSLGDSNDAKKSKGKQRSKSFNNDKSANKPMRRISSHHEKTIVEKTKGKSQVRKSSLDLMNPLLNQAETQQHPEMTQKSKEIRRVHFGNKIRFKKIKHSKIDPSRVWYSEKEIAAQHMRAEKEVLHQAQACNDTTLLNLEGLSTVQEYNTMYQRQAESQRAVFEVQDVHRRVKEQQAASAIFRSGVYMETLSDYYEQDEVIAEEYGLFTSSAIQSAHERATHLAMHVNLLWDQHFEYAGIGGGWQEIKFVSAPIAAKYRPSVHCQRTALAQ